MGKAKSEPSSDGFYLELKSNLSGFVVQEAIWKRIIAMHQFKKRERESFGEYAKVIWTE